MKSTKLKLTLTLKSINQIFSTRKSSQSPKWEQPATVEKLVAAVEAKAAGAQYPSTKEERLGVQRQGEDR